MNHGKNDACWETSKIVPHATEFPSGILSTPRYQVRFARTREEIEAALRLRFEVFNLELGEGLAESFKTGLDRDAFDEQCHHLIVSENETGSIIGTYRMQTQAMAKRGSGFYSWGLFDLNAFPSGVLERSVEVGRACIASAHRNSKVLFLLWRGLAMYMVFQKKRYLFGCSSLTSQNPSEGRFLMECFRRTDRIHAHVRIEPQPGKACLPDETVGQPAVEVAIPRLFKTYLDNGAKVCGPPAIDREFKTIDFLMLLDLEDLEPRKVDLFFEGLEA